MECIGQWFSDGCAAFKKWLTDSACETLLIKGANAQTPDTGKHGIQTS
jgi:hypothetical protein